MTQIDRTTIAYWTSLCSQLSREADRLSYWKSEKNDGKNIQLLQLCILTLREADRRLNQMCDIIIKEIEDETT